MATYAVLARLIGPDGRTEAEYAVPAPAPTRLYMAAARAPRFVGEPDDPCADIRRLTYELSTVLGPEDGGPLAIYHRRVVEFASAL